MQNILRKKYFEHLNATRFIAFLPVFFTHCFYTNSNVLKQNLFYKFVQNHLQLGLLGLDYFFVLSSFLISWIIFEEYNVTTKFATINFYVRRSLRIFPLYFLVVFFGFFLTFLSQFVFETSIENLPPFYNFGLFVLNFYMMENGFNFLFFLTFFWSVSVEEQFYIFWAIAMKYFKKQAHLFGLFLIVISIFFRATHLHENDKLVFHTFSSLGNFGVGCLLCYYFVFNKDAKKKFNKISHKLKLTFYFFSAMIFMFYNQIFVYDFMVVFERLIFAIVFAFYIADFTFSDKATFNLEKYKWMGYFGQLSFGLYCYHGIVLTFAIKLIIYFNVASMPVFVFVITPFLAFVITLILAHLSYKYFEKPFLKLKVKYI